MLVSEHEFRRNEMQGISFQLLIPVVLKVDQGMRIISIFDAYFIYQTRKKK